MQNIFLISIQRSFKIDILLLSSGVIWKVVKNTNTSCPNIGSLQNTNTNCPNEWSLQNTNTNYPYKWSLQNTWACFLPTFTGLLTPSPFTSRTCPSLTSNCQPQPQPVNQNLLTKTRTTTNNQNQSPNLNQPITTHTIPQPNHNRTTTIQQQYHNHTTTINHHNQVKTWWRPSWSQKRVTWTTSCPLSASTTITTTIPQPYHTYHTINHHNQVDTEHLVTTLMKPEGEELTTSMDDLSLPLSFDKKVWLSFRSNWRARLLNAILEESFSRSEVRGG